MITIVVVQAMTATSQSSTSLFMVSQRPAQVTCLLKGKQD
jgi:hypothetical protein